MLKIGDYISAQELANELKVKVSTINRWARIRNLPCIKHPLYRNQRLFDKKNVEAFLNPVDIKKEN